MINRRATHGYLAVDGHPHPVRRARHALDRLALPHRALLDSTEHRIELIELQLCNVELTEAIRGKGGERLRCVHQPVQHGVRGDLEDAGGGAQTEPLGSARQYVDEQHHGDLLAMEDGTVVCGEIPPHAGHWHGRQGPPLGWPLARRLPRPSQPR